MYSNARGWSFKYITGPTAPSNSIHDGNEDSDTLRDVDNASDQVGHGSDIGGRMRDFADEDCGGGGQTEAMPPRGFDEGEVQHVRMVGGDATSQKCRFQIPWVTSLEKHLLLVGRVVIR